MREGTFTAEEKEWFIEWVVQMGLRTKCSELGLYQILAFMAYAAQPLEHKLPALKNKVPIASMHGEYDWVTRETADKLIRDRKIDGEVFVVSGGGHHLYAENPTECVSDIIKFTDGEQAMNDFISSV